MGLFGQRPEGDTFENRNARLQSGQEDFRAQSRSTKFVRKPQNIPSSSNPYRTPIQPNGGGKTTAKSRLASDSVAVVGTIVLVIGVAGYIIFGTQYFAVQSIQVDDTKYVSKETIRDAASNSISHKLLWLIPRNRTLTMWSSKIEKDIVEALGNPYAVESVEVIADYPSTVVVHITERVPSIGWVTKNAQGVEQYYTIDRSGTVTERFQKKDEMRKNIPIVVDQNRSELGLGWHIISSDYVAQVIELSQKLDTLQVPVEQFLFPPLVCTEQEYIAEQIFEQEIANSETEELREKKRSIQERFKSGELGIDDSLNELEKLKQEEAQKTITASNAAALAVNTEQGKLEWKTVNKTVECDFVTVATDVTAQTTRDWGGAVIRFDTSRSLSDQIQQLQQGMRSSDIIPADRNMVKSIDVRIPDRLYILKK